MVSAMDHLDTRVVWGGEDASLAHGGTQVPVQHSIAFGYEDVDTWLDVALGRTDGHIYSRNTNPTVRAFERKIADLEGAEHAIGFASGMAAVSGTLFTLLSPGIARRLRQGHVRRHQPALHRHPAAAEGRRRPLRHRADARRSRLRSRSGCDVLYLETPTNPTLKVVDIAPLTAAAHERGAIVVVDNTFATPINQLPLELGADLVIHSASKFLGGHADALGGALAGRRELVDRVYHFREITGAALSPHDAYMLLRGMKTLALRIERQNASAARIAAWLEAQDTVERCSTPGSRPTSDTRSRPADVAASAGCSASPVGGFEAVRRFLPRLRLAHRAANLGAVETIAGTPATTSHVECTAEERAAMGIPEALVRLSVGIEDPDDLIADLTQAMA